MTWQSGVALVVTFLAALSDLRSGKVPNRLTYAAAAGALLMSLILPPRDFIGSLTGLTGSLGLYLILHLFAGLGAGDVKLMAVVGALKGLAFSLYASFYILCAGVAAALVILAWKGCLTGSLKWVFSVLAGSFSTGARRASKEYELHAFPFAPVIFTGVAWTIWLEYAHGPVTLEFWN